MSQQTGGRRRAAVLAKKPELMTLSQNYKLYGKGMKVQSHGILKSTSACSLTFVVCVFVLVLVQSAPVRAFGKPVVRVNGKTLTEIDLEAALNEIMPAGVFHGGFSSQKRASYRPRALQEMIDKELLYQEAVSRGLRVSMTQVEADQKKVVKRLGGKEKFKGALKRAGLTEKQYIEILKKKHHVKQIVQLEVKDKAVVTDKEVYAYYEMKKKTFIRPEARKLKHILISVKPSATVEERNQRKQKAWEVMERIQAGEDMSAAAWGYSDGPYRVKGGDIGLVHKGRLNPELEKAVFDLELGRLSGIIETIYGYHLVRVEEIKAPEQLTLDDVYPKIKKALTQRKEKQLQDALTASLWAKARIEML
jgi:peptidyl-prolyl cis-trans isomerase C